MLAIPIFLLGGLASLVAFALAPRPISPEHLQRDLTLRIKEAGNQSSHLFANEFRQNLTKLHAAETEAVKEAATYVASQQYPYYK